jgi:Mrp family chromosome partitioning ATPase
MGYGVPAEWLDDVRRVNEDSLLVVADRLPAEAAEALLELATGGKPRILQPVAAEANPFDHPDAQRRFRVMTNVEELQRALDFPWERWTVFLHPEQREFVERDYNGPARVSGSAGTGKTIVALHRAAHLARTNPDARVLLATFSDRWPRRFTPSSSASSAASRVSASESTSTAIARTAATPFPFSTARPP